MIAIRVMAIVLTPLHPVISAYTITHIPFHNFYTIIYINCHTDYTITKIHYHSVYTVYTPSANGIDTSGHGMSGWTWAEILLVHIVMTRPIHHRHLNSITLCCSLVYSLLPIL